jgi:hypothetical protein
VHAASARANRPFITLNCAGPLGTLLESELCGHVKLAHTGSVFLAARKPLGIMSMVLSLGKNGAIGLVLLSPAQSEDTLYPKRHPV